MLYLKNTIILILLLSTCTLAAQVGLNPSNLEHSNTNIKFDKKVFELSFYQNKDKTQKHLSLVNFKIDLPSMKATSFFCKLEDKRDQKKGLNWRFRLGSLDYVNELESK